MQEPDIQAIVETVLAELQASEGATADIDQASPAADGDDLQIDLEDPTLPAARQQPGIEQPINPDGLCALMAATPARIGVGRSGPRPRTAANLLFLADHGVTQDALMHAVDADLL